jgi:MATE family multidrug resistance protein
MGISSAISTRVGNLLGAGLPWARPAWTGIGMGAAIMLFSGAMYAMFPGPLSGLFTDDPEVLAVAVTLLPLAAAFQVFDGTQVCAFAALRGAGDSRLPGVANLVGYWLIGLPFGWWASERGGYGARGVWLGLALGLAIVAALLVARLRVITLRGGRLVASGG